MPVMTEAPGEKKPRYKMRLTNNEFLEEYGGHLAAGDVVIVDEDTAIRWLEKHIAVQAGQNDKTAAEIRREQLRKQLVPVEVDEDEAPHRQPLRSTSRRARATVAPQLVGAGVVNSLDDVPEEHHDTDEDD